MQRHFRIDLVDVLPAGPRAPSELEAELGLVDRHLVESAIAQADGEPRDLVLLHEAVAAVDLDRLPRRAVGSL